ncbi:hypothetical protein CJ030_MR5G009652 [Morella rubra]|uniref:RNase H type-1 domain-containing protein n=1 Tax=Morella rubra TaxID=262757 RepID=A0A6A1VKK7_9ROSI|nr:hypothetical protein CJ030_MR5G009652 [Morella rubra]
MTQKKHMKRQCTTTQEELRSTKMAPPHGHVSRDTTKSAWGVDSKRFSKPKELIGGTTTRPQDVAAHGRAHRSDGLVLFAWTKRIPPGTPLAGEARATLFAVQEAHFLSFPLIEFEGDNLHVCQALNLPYFSPDWSIASLIQDTLALLTLHASWKVSHVRRGANMLAHNVAKWACTANMVGNIPSSCIPFTVLNADNPLFSRDCIPFLVEWKFVRKKKKKVG